VDIPGLRIGRQLGSGGFGVVYQARQVQVDRDVAVKVDNRVLDTPSERDKFLREARAAARLSGHPHVVSIYDAGVAADGRPYIVMELCPGGSLDDVLRRDGPFPINKVVDMGLRIADALSEAHAAGVLHRDIKPANVLVDSFGAVKLADFGLAAILDAQEATVTLGALSPSYAAPEAFAWSAPTPAADVYSLAATLYTLATGRTPRDVPWPAKSLDELATALRGEVRPIPGAPPNVNAALIRTLANNASARTPSARLFADELSGAVSVPRRRRLWPVLVAALAVVAVAVGVYFLIPESAPSPAGAPPPSTAPAPPNLTQCASGFCTATGQCFKGLVIIGGKPASANSTPCDSPHYWEAYAGGWLPADAMDHQQSEIQAMPEVTNVCKPEVTQARVPAGVDTSGWKTAVLPRSTAGRPYFYCLADGGTGQHTGQIFTSG
jgi:serine/threonine protein kinase